MLAGHLGARLGFVRVGFDYFISEAVFAYILEAIHLLAEHAWKLLPLYHFDPAVGCGSTATPLRRYRRSPTRPSRALPVSPSMH